MTMTAPQCAGRIYGCRWCGKDKMTINESFSHECAQRPRPTLQGVSDALAEVRPRYLADTARVRVEDGKLTVRITLDAVARFEGMHRRYGTAVNRVSDPLTKRGYRVRMGNRSMEVY